MKLAEMYAKDINRTIDGVIKASEDEHVRLEVEEYVFTAEIKNGLSRILEQYTSPHPKSNGVWISGFFGSGKSHLLKMTSFLLGDVQGSSSVSRDFVAEQFLQKASQDAFLQASLKKAAAIPATSLLFNIDAKDDKAQSSKNLALLGVFYREFYRACGYYDRDLAVARLERDLDSLHKLAQFKEAFTQVSGGKRWEDARKAALFANGDAEAALAQIGSPITNPIKTYRDNLALSAEGFAEEVRDWIDRQGPTYRLNFFIDEVGQYIGTDTKLMLSLQTVTEELFSKCQGRSSVFVTSQEQLSSVLGELADRRGDDFSKIQGRFDTQVNLSTQEVEEVVSKRLLTKTDQASAALRQVYDAHQAEFESAFSFPNWEKTYRNYPTAASFVDTYPFVNYQFDMFTQTMIGLSSAGAFTGRHSSVGARSLLGVAQQIAKDIQNKQVGVLASFDQFYDGMDQSLNSDIKLNVQRAVAQFRDSNPLAIRVLKTLLLVRYVQNFPKDPKNLRVLLRRDLDEDVAQLEADIEEALKQLERQVLVQRMPNGTYEYLTNEEQDIKREIDSMPVSNSQVWDYVKSAIVSALGSDATKYRYPDSKMDLNVGMFVDDTQVGGEQQIAIRYYTPNAGVDEGIVAQRSVGSQKDLFVLLDLQVDHYTEIETWHKTNDYLRRNSTSAQGSASRFIVEHKANNAERNASLQKDIADSIRNARFFVNGLEVSPSSRGNAKDAVRTALGRVVATVYNRIGEVKSFLSWTESNIGLALQDDEGGIFTSPEVATLSSLANEVAQWINTTRQREGKSTYVSDAVEHYHGAPCGWPAAVTLAIIARGVRDNKLEVSHNQAPVPRTQLAQLLATRSEHKSLLVEQKKTYDRSQVARLLTVANDLTNAWPQMQQAAEAPKEVTKYAYKVIEEMRQVAESDFAFAAQADQVIGAFEPFSVTHNVDFFMDGQNMASLEELLDVKEDFVEPVGEFFRKHLPLAEKARQLALSPENYDLPGADAQLPGQIQALLESPNLYNLVPKLKAATEDLERAQRALAEEQHRLIEAELAHAVEGVQASQQWQQASEASRERVGNAIAEFEKLVASSANSAQLSSLQLKLNAAKTSWVNELMRVSPVPAPAAAAQGDAAASPAAEPARQPAQPKQPRAKSISSFLGSSSLATISSTQELDEYLGQLRVQLADFIDDGGVVTL